MTAKKQREAKRAIEAQLRRVSKDWVRAGSWRLLGYNSPMVPPAKRFWELQVPVKRTGSTQP